MEQCGDPGDSRFVPFKDAMRVMKQQHEGIIDEEEDEEEEIFSTQKQQPEEDEDDLLAAFLEKHGQPGSSTPVQTHQTPQKKVHTSKVTHFEFTLGGKVAGRVNWCLAEQS